MSFKFASRIGLLRKIVATPSLVRTDPNCGGFFFAGAIMDVVESTPETWDRDGVSCIVWMGYAHCMDDHFAPELKEYLSRYDEAVIEHGLELCKDSMGSGNYLKDCDAIQKDVCLDGWPEADEDFFLDSNRFSVAVQELADPSMRSEA